MVEILAESIVALSERSGKVVIVPVGTKGEIDVDTDFSLDI